MTDATLQMFREIAATMSEGQAKKDWAIAIRENGRLFVKAFGYTEERARHFAPMYRNGVAVHESEILPR